ncbi:hypothetical protein DPMN_152932 [Dreissena polymorpha]|uniref:Uncharacterized protein n=1 Tax=Dreissena polymorpha TaxID=45954 RepID=A0A9D4J5L9_DREPO|nr:hypothetical protein DPMN_152932 [Dreissena polymorpha]
MQKSKAQQKSNFDKTSRTLAPLSVNDSVRIKFGKIWKLEGSFMKVHSDRSYIVQTADGGTYRRNRSVMHKTRENTSDIKPFDALVLQPDEPIHDNPQVVLLSIPDFRNYPIINPDTGYRTRKGRLVIDIRKYAGNEWTK